MGRGSGPQTSSSAPSAPRRSARLLQKALSVADDRDCRADDSSRGCASTSPPALTGAGHRGASRSAFGAQTIVRDVISGFFLILEDQCRVGDCRRCQRAGAALVEEINLRTIVLRDEEGTVHVFPNGEIKTLANKSKDLRVLRRDVRHRVRRGSRGASWRRCTTPRRRWPATRSSSLTFSPPLENRGSRRVRGRTAGVEGADQDRAV